MDSIPLPRINRQLTIFLHRHEPLHCPRLVTIPWWEIGVFERCSTGDVILACFPVIIDILLRVVLAKPTTDRLRSSQRILLRLFKVLLPLLPILETIFLST